MHGAKNIKKPLIFRRLLVYLSADETWRKKNYLLREASQ
jgi:hypothetical protein